MRRREFISLVGGAAAWPIAARAQQPERMRRIGVLMSTYAEDEQEGKLRFAAFIEGLRQLDWIVGRNVQIDIRWGVGGTIRKAAAELVAAAPDVIVGANSDSTIALREI